MRTGEKCCRDICPLLLVLFGFIAPSAQAQVSRVQVQPESASSSSSSGSSLKFNLKLNPPSRGKAGPTSLSDFKARRISMSPHCARKLPPELNRRPIRCQRSGLR